MDLSKRTAQGAISDQEAGQILGGQRRSVKRAQAVGGIGCVVANSFSAGTSLVEI